jgi:hypothetical protein
MNDSILGIFDVKSGQIATYDKLGVKTNNRYFRELSRAN